MDEWVSSLGLARILSMVATMFRGRSGSRALRFCVQGKHGFMIPVIPNTALLTSAPPPHLYDGARLQNARCRDSASASCNGFTSPSDHHNRRQSPLIGLN